MYWRGKKEERKKKQDKNIMSAPAMQGSHNNQQWRNFATKSGGDMGGTSKACRATARGKSQERGWGHWEQQRAPPNQLGGLAAL